MERQALIDRCGGARPVETAEMIITEIIKKQRVLTRYELKDIILRRYTEIPTETNGCSGIFRAMINLDIERELADVKSLTADLLLYPEIIVRTQHNVIST